MQDKPMKKTQGYLSVATRLQAVFGEPPSQYFGQALQPAYQ